MWENQDPDPGGTSRKAPSPQELSELKDQNEQQLVLIAQLKEMLRKEQSTVSQEKVEEYVNTLNRARAKRSKKKGDSTSGSSATTSSANIDANKKERLNLLRQQLEENKARLAERGKSQKGIEEMVTQIQAQLKDSQTLISPSPLSVPLIEAKELEYNENTPQKELYNILLTKEKRVTELLSKNQKLEGTVLDLQENLKEKDSVIDARTKAITLMTDSLSKKGKNTLDELEETKEQMRKMQENFVTLEAEMKARQLTLLNDLKIKNFEISELQEINDKLEKEKLEMEQKLSGRLSSPASPMDSSNLEELRRQIEQLQLENKNLKTNVPSDYEDLQEKFEKLSQINADHISKITDLKLHLQEALSQQKEQDEARESEVLEENKKLIEDNQRLIEENSQQLSKICEIEKQLEESLLSVKDLDKKDGENRKLIEENERLSQANSQHLSKVNELEKQLEGALTDLKLLKNTGMAGSTRSDKEENEEILKLKKQLDESNKSMIKMRAIQKGKIKELNKKLDQFRKMNDANALIAQLQNEISKLNETIAELEDEKGNLQLKMVESTTSSKGDSTEQLEEEIKQLKDKLNTSQQELDEKDKIIRIMEAEVLTLKADLKQKSEEEIKVSSQVSSEMSSICYEEQIETLETEKNKLLEQIDTLNSEKEVLLQELELSKKEKQDLNAKLESYIQENMELIDKLEKLSTEKVSSVESIEIVEGLTQQEKLELAAYQKHINPEESLKCHEDDAIEPPAELNESVLQLSEDTAELLQKIEMFTQERKEVMQKMESLKEENNMLALKVKEIENNRDILEETYEQLQNEKDALLNEKQELSDQLEKIQKDEISKKNEDQSAIVLDSELKDLQIKYEALIQENDELKRTLKDFDSVVQEKYDLENRLRDITENNTSLDTKLNSNLDEINAYQLTIEENKKEFVNSAETINRLRSQLEERENDIQELHINISELNSVISELQSKQGDFETIESELENLKSALSEHITQASDYESEISQNNDTIKKLNVEILGVNRRILELENELELKDSEIGKLIKDITNKDEIIKRLQADITEKDRSFRIVSEDMKGKYLELQRRLDNDGSLQEQVVELNNKNKEQLEKMKKIAANLKKKTQAYQELEEHYKNEKEKWETEDKEKNHTVDLLQEKLASVAQSLEDTQTRLKFTVEENTFIQNELSLLREQLQVLEQSNADQQHYIQELKHKQEKLHETSLQQEMSASLHEEVDTSFSKQVPDDKIRELELLLETNESELNHSKERIDRLQEDIRKLQEAKSELEVINAELVEKLELTSNSFKEKALLEDQLELRLAEVTASDEALTKKLQESQNEREELVKKNQEHEELIKRLKIKLKKAHDKVTELKTVQTNLQELETVNQELKVQIASLEDNQRHIQSENECLQRRNMSDYEKIEADYQNQLAELLKVKNDLTTDNEKLLERIKEFEDREQELIMELDEYKIRLVQIEKSSAEDVKLFKEELESEKCQNQRLTTELDEVNFKLQESTTQLEHLRQQLNSSNGQLMNFGLLQTQLDSLLSEKNELVASIKDANDNLEQVMAEANDLRQALHQSNNALQASCQDVKTLTNEMETMKHEILALEFAKSSLEASCESSQKLEVQEYQEPVQLVSTEKETLANFQWPDQSHPKHYPADLDLFGNSVQQQTNTEINENQAVLLIEVNEKLEKSMSETTDLKQQLSTSRQEADSLKGEVDTLKKEILALQFAKSTLEASYESSQKPVDTAHLDHNKEGVVMEEFTQQIGTSHKVQQPTVPLFSAFSQPVNSSVFDSFGSVPSSGEQSFNQSSETVSVSEGQQAPQSSVNLDIVDSNIPSRTEQSQLFSPVIEEGREALLKKIKALEFLLYNVDKEKEIALEQCTEMVNELTQIIYDKTKARFSQESLRPDLEDQVLSQQDVDRLASDKQSLQQTEYAHINKDFGENLAHVDEEIIEPKKAYLCFDDDRPPKKDSKKADKKPTDLESEILTGKDIAEASTSKKELQKLEYERVDESLGEQQQPVVEPLAQPKHAYLCYTKDEKPQSIEAFEENDDGWGWGPEEARLEEEHMSTLENTPQVKNLLLEIQQLKENIKLLQVERDNHLEEIKQLQIKSGKLIRKCKELKSKNDQVTTSKQDDGGFFDLNETIQEELKTQVQQLEKKLRELTAEHEKEKAEKSNLLKRVDVLTAANDRMTEMKEIQDSEVRRWQRKHEEAVQKLQESEWGSDGFGEVQKNTLDIPQPSSLSSQDQSSKMKELEDTIKDLTLDNEELQTLLEEQSAKRLEAEKNKNSGNEEELSELRSFNEALHKEMHEVKLNTGELQAAINQAGLEMEKLTQEKLFLENVVHEKEVLVQELLENMDELRQKEQQKNLDDIEMSGLKSQITSHQEVLQEKDVIIADLQDNLEQLNNRKLELDHVVAQLHNDLNLKTDEILRLQSTLHQSVTDNFEIQELRSQIEFLNSEVRERDDVINRLNNGIEQLKAEKAAIEDSQDELSNKLQTSEEALKKVMTEKEQSDLELQATLQKLQAKILKVEEGEALINDLQTCIKAKNGQENQHLVEQLESKSRELEEKQCLLDELQLKITESNQGVAHRDDRRTKEIEELKAERMAKETEIQRLLAEVQNKEEEFQNRVSSLVNELNENWQIQVDQRGADIAESWKVHLEMVEKDYTSVQEKLKSDILDLEEKCNILVNENNELRKNVDQEIRNEVDKMSALQQQISNLQQTINSLNQAVQDKDKQIEEIQNNLSNYLSLENELQTLRRENAEKENKLASINIIIETTQKQFDEKREVVEEIVSVLEKRALSPLSYEKQEILQEFQRQLGLSTGKDDEICRLNQSFHELEEKLNRISGEKNREITGLNQVIEDLEKDLSIVHEKEAEIVRLSTELTNIQLEKEKVLQDIELVKQEKENLKLEMEKIKQEHSNCLATIEDCNRKVQEYYNAQVSLQNILDQKGKDVTVIAEKEAEVVRLHTELDNIRLAKERLVEEINLVKQEKELLQLESEKIKQDHSNCLLTVEDCNRKVQEYYNAQVSLQRSLEERNKEIICLNRQLRELQERARNDSNKEMESVNTALATMKEDCLVLQGSLSESQNLLFEAKQQLAEKTKELQTANDNILHYQQNYSYYDQEINRLKELLEQREREYNNSLEMLKNNQLADVQRHYDELLSNRDLDINTLRGQVQELAHANQTYSDRLNQELALKQQLEEQLREQTQLVDEDTKQLEELKLIIEDQVTKIEELKKELFAKSNQYDSLIAEMDVGRVPVTTQPSSSAAASSADVQRRQYDDDDLSEPVSRAELDLALYMLHQRDVRCEELTVELTHLLEERDTLQLRLSNAIREKEELRRCVADSSSMPSTSSSIEISPTQSKSSAIFLAASGTELAKEPLETDQTLATKLSELKNVGYKKDKTFVDEQEARRLQQLAIMQQHINEASKLPPEAAAKLVDASYTLSRDVQSPSKVLLNWLWGKNPPKANDS